MCLSISVCIFAEHILFGYICSILNAVLPFNVMGSPVNKGCKQRLLLIQEKELKNNAEVCYHPPCCHNIIHLPTIWMSGRGHPETEAKS